MPTGKGSPYKFLTGSPEAYDTKARVGAPDDGYPLPEYPIPEFPDMTPQDHNGMADRSTLPSPPTIRHASKPTSGGMGGPLE